MNTDLARFERGYIPVPEAGCWLWIGCAPGYGSFRLDDGKSRSTKAYRATWMLLRGEIPAGLSVCHKCDTPSCVNPDHLFLGTHAENCQDRAAKGRGGNLKGERNGRSKLTAEDVRAIRAESGISQERMASKYGITQSVISAIRRRARWPHVA